MFHSNLQTLPTRLQEANNAIANDDKLGELVVVLWTFLIG